MFALGLFLAGAGTVAILIGLFSHAGEFIGWNMSTQTAIVVGAIAGAAIVLGIRLIRYGAVKGVKNAMAQRKLEKRSREVND